MNICDKIYKNKKYVVILIIILIIICLLYLIFIVYENFESSKNNYIIRSDCKYLHSDTLMTILNENLKKFNYTIYIPCIYEDINKEYNSFNYNPNGIYFLIDNVDIMIGKEFLYQFVSKHYGKEQINTLMPKSWVLNVQLDKFIDEFDKNKLYILKKNTQRQNGIHISNNIDDIKEIVEKDKNTDFPYAIIQELLQDPYLISGRKINLRVYVLMVRQGNKTELYVYNDGFMYYTSELFKKNSTDIATNITTGYIDRKVYEENPLTHSDFKTYLDSNRILSEYEKQIRSDNKIISTIVFDNIYNLINNIFKVFFYKIGNKQKLYKNKKFQLFGCDIAVDEKLNSKIMEINKGPDLDAKDKRDSELKHNLVRDVFKTVDLITNDGLNGFINLT
jgi:hypothetical protein